MKIIKTMFILLVLMSFFILSKVNALETKTINLGSSNTSGYDGTGYGNFLFNNINFGTSFQKALNFTGVTVDNFDYMQFALQLQYNQDNNYSETETEYQPVENTQYYCSSWSQRQQTYADGTQSTYYVCEIWSPSGQSSFYQNSTIGEMQNIPQIGLMIDLIYNNNTVSPCEIKSSTQQNSIVECKLKSNLESISFIRIRNVANPYYNNIQGRIGIENYLFFWKDPINSSTNDIITNQNQNQQQSHQDMQNINNSINNNNVSGANQDANSFVNNQAFQDNTGLTGIITAPLSVINSLTSTCSPIRLPIPYLDTNVEIPCIGDLLSTKMGSVIQLVKVVINGYICYLIGLDMFKIVKHARDPNDDRIEVLDL